MSVRKTEFSQTGWRLVFVASGLLIVGALFSNVALLALAALPLLYLLIDEITFHRILTQAEELLTVESKRTLKCTVASKVELESTIHNRSNSDFRIIGLSRVSQDQLFREEALSQSFLLGRKAKVTVKVRVEWQIPGHFRIPALKIELISRWRALSESVSLRDEAIAIVRPRVDNSHFSSVDSSRIEELIADPIRRGHGTDLAGIKPSAVLDDFHRIDWKATARTGQFMVKDFHFERQPTVMLLIDASLTMKTRSGQQSIFDELVCVLPRFLTSLRPETPIGVSLYTESSVLTELPPRSGKYQNELIIQALLPYAGQEVESGVIVPERIRNTAGWNANDQSSRIFKRILLFQRDIASRNREKLRSQGIFMVLSHVCNLREPVLVVTVTDGKMNMNGLIEGTRAATLLGHRVVVALLTTRQRIPTTYVVPELESVRVRMYQCLPNELSSVVSFEIDAMSRERVIPRPLDAIGV